MSSDTESPAELQYRLHAERECRRIAELVKAELPENRAFILVTADYGDPKDGFSNTSYVAKVRRDDAARLLTELLDYWMAQGTGTQPTVKLATLLREGVFALAGASLRKLLHTARCSTRDAEAALQLNRTGEAKLECIKAATALLAVYEQLDKLTAQGRAG